MNSKIFRTVTREDYIAYRATLTLLTKPSNCGLTDRTE
jgi:hypothetical protein